MHRLHPTKSVLDIARRLEAAGFEAWCVGGAIRDALLGGDPLDWDLATTATPDRVIALFGRRRTIPVGIDFGTVSVLDGRYHPQVQAAVAQAGEQGLRHGHLLGQRAAVVEIGRAHV